MKRVDGAGNRVENETEQRRTPKHPEMRPSPAFSFPFSFAFTFLFSSLSFAFSFLFFFSPGLSPDHRQRPGLTHRTGRGAGVSQVKPMTDD